MKFSVYFLSYTLKILKYVSGLKYLNLIKLFSITNLTRLQFRFQNKQKEIQRAYTYHILVFQTEAGSDAVHWGD